MSSTLSHTNIPPTCSLGSFFFSAPSPSIQLSSAGMQQRKISPTISSQFPLPLYSLEWITSIWWHSNAANVSSNLIWSMAEDGSQNFSCVCTRALLNCPRAQATPRLWTKHTSIHLSIPAAVTQTVRTVCFMSRLWLRLWCFPAFLVPIVSPPSSVSVCFWFIRFTHLLHLVFSFHLLLINSTTSAREAPPLLPRPPRAVISRLLSQLQWQKPAYNFPWVISCVVNSK